MSATPIEPKGGYPVFDGAAYQRDLTLDRVEQALEQVYVGAPWKRHMGLVKLHVSDHLPGVAAVSFPRDSFDLEVNPTDKTIGTAVVSRDWHRAFQAAGCSDDELAAMVWDKRKTK
jgi:hypothetical protein